MIREHLPLWYGECEPDGSWAGLDPDKAVLTNRFAVPLTPEGNPLFLRKRGTLLAGQGGSGLNDWFWAGLEWQKLGPSYGVNTVAFDNNNKPIQNRVEWGSQGIRWIDAWGVHTADATNAHPSIPLLREYTTHGDITVGQGGIGGAIAVVAGKRVRVAEGDCTFIRFNRSGDSLAISVVHPGSLEFIWCTKSELLSLPEDILPSEQPKPEPQPVPEPKHEETPMSLVDDVYNSLVSIRQKYPVKNMTPQELGAYLNESVWPFKSQGVGLETKSSGDVAFLPDAARTPISHDTIRFPGNVGGDFLLDAEGAARPQRGELKPADPAKFIAPVEPAKPAPAPAPTPVPEPTPTPQPAPTPEPAIVIEFIEPVLAQLEAVRVSINGLKASVDQLNKNGIKVHF